MPPDDAPPAAYSADRLTALVADTVADPRPPGRLLSHLRALRDAGDAGAAALGTALFESIHYRLPAFSDDDLPQLAGDLYARGGRGDAAFLLAGLAAQLRPAGTTAPAAQHARPSPPPDPEIAEKAAALVRDPQPGEKLLRVLEALDNDAGRPAAAALFEAVWPRVRPMEQYWVYHRMSHVYAHLGRDDASALLATLAIQVEPSDPASDGPYRLLLRHFRDAARFRDAAELCIRRHALCAAPRLVVEGELLDLLSQAGKLLLSPPPAGRTDREVMPSEPRRPRLWRGYGDGMPICTRQLLAEMKRDPISVAELRDAEVLLDRGAVAVFGADGAPHTDLSLRCFPPMLRRRLDERAPGGVERIEADTAVLISDEYPGPNLCHFMLDHATRLELYKRAGIAIGEVTVIGPELRTEYQQVTAQRLGVRDYVPVNLRARVRVNRLVVSSTCHRLRHPAHWAAEWAVQAVRSPFDLAPRRPARRLLISRRDSEYRRITNEAKVANLLEPLGFEVIVPGELDFFEQIAAFRDATHVIAPHGAGLANILWCAPGTHVLEVFHPHYGTWAYAMLNDVLDLDYASMVARDGCSQAPEFNDPGLPREVTATHAGRDMWVDTDELERWLIDSEAL